jgi:hypothetical protein
MGHSLINGLNTFPKVSDIPVSSQSIENLHILKRGFRITQAVDTAKHHLGRAAPYTLRFRAGRTGASESVGSLRASDEEATQWLTVGKSRHLVFPSLKGLTIAAVGAAHGFRHPNDSFDPEGLT